MSLGENLIVECQKRLQGLFRCLLAMKQSVFQQGRLGGKVDGNTSEVISSLAHPCL